MLTYDMTDHGGAPLYEYLFQCIARDIREGHIEANEKLPSKRALAKHLGVSVITVEGAYAQLIAEGYIRAEERRGYFACTLLPLAAPAQKTRHTVAEKDKMSKKPDQTRQIVADLRGGSPSSALFPYELWARSLREALSRESESVLVEEQDARGTLRLRRALADHLRGYRGLDVSPDQIVVGAGAQYLYGLIIQLLGRDRTVALETPGYPRLKRIYAVNDVSVVEVPMDAEGVSMAALEQSGANLVHLTPSHQFPTGLVTSMPRRTELLAWAAQDARRMIVEDDYDCEFRLAGKPIAPLQQLDGRGQVIYTNTFSKSLGPAVRVGYMVLPPDLAQEYCNKLGFYSCPVSAVDQLALARFIESGAYERHVNRMRTYCRDIRDGLINALKASPLASRLEIKSADSGIHFLLGVRTNAAETELAARAEGEGVLLAPLSSFASNQAVNRDSIAWFVVSYAALEAESIDPCVQALARAWRE